MLNIIIIREMQMNIILCTTTHRLKWITLKNKRKRLSISSAGKDAKQLDLSYITGGNAKFYTPFGKLFRSF